MVVVNVEVNVVKLGPSVEVEVEGGWVLFDEGRGGSACPRRAKSIPVSLSRMTPAEARVDIQNRANAFVNILAETKVRCSRLWTIANDSGTTKRRNCRE